MFLADLKAQVALLELFKGQICKLIDFHCITFDGFTIMLFDNLCISQKDMSPKSLLIYSVILMISSFELLERLLIVERHYIYRCKKQAESEGCQQNFYHVLQQQTYKLCSAILSMLTHLQEDFYQYLTNNESKTQIINKSITLDRVYRLLQDKFQGEYDEGTIFAQDFFKVNLKKVAQVIMNAVYRSALPLIKIEHIVIFTSILQHILYQKSFNIPETISKRVQTYVHYLIIMQGVQTIRSMLDDGLNSTTVAHFYRNIYVDAYLFRCKRVCLEYGLQVQKCGLPHYLLQCIIQQKQGLLDRYSSKVTAQWVILSLIYFVLTVKADIYKQKAVFARIINKYKTIDSGLCIVREINWDELCHFYNEIIVRLMGKLQEKEVQRLVNEIKTDIDISSLYLVSPIYDQNNTVLDNIVFSSSWEP